MKEYKSKEPCKRISSLASLIQTVVAQLIQKEIADPRLRLVTITGVDVSSDGKNATVFFSLLDNQSDQVKAVGQAFEKAKGFFRVRLSQMTELRHTPKLTFKYDISIVTGERITQLLS